VRSVQAACRLGGSRRVKVETVERLCRKVLGTDPRELYGEAFAAAWQHRGKRVNERVQAFDHCFSSPRACRCWPPAAAPRPGGCWPKDGPRRGVPEVGQLSCRVVLFMDQAAEDVTAAELSCDQRLRLAMAL
jgi:hypothetical protein